MDYILAIVVDRMVNYEAFGIRHRAILHAVSNDKTRALFKALTQTVTSDWDWETVKQSEKKWKSNNQGKNTTMCAKDKTSEEWSDGNVSSAAQQEVCVWVGDEDGKQYTEQTLHKRIKICSLVTTSLSIEV